MSTRSRRDFLWSFIRGRARGHRERGIQARKIVALAESWGLAFFFFVSIMSQLVGIFCGGYKVLVLVPLEWSMYCRFQTFEW